MLADGTVVERLGGVLKDSTGYDWPSVPVPVPVALRERPTGLEAAEFVLPGALRLVCEGLDLRAPFGEGGATDDRAAEGRQTLVLLESRAPTGAFDLLAAALSEHPQAEHAILAEGAETAGLWRYREGSARRSPGAGS